MPVWLEIKENTKFTGGPSHVYRVIETFRYLLQTETKLNVSFALKEKLWAAMIFDKKIHIRVLKARECVLG